jgi:FkbM family methyltransferase
VSTNGRESALGRRLQLRRVAGDGFRRVGARLARIGDGFYTAPESSAQRAIRSWVDRQGDQTLRLGYDLGRDSLVIDVGGFRGQWASDIYARFRCRVLVFEPVPEFASQVARRFAHNDDVEVVPMGLAGRSRREDMLQDEDASSALLSGGRRVSVDLVAAVPYLEKRGISAIDLMKINIEGGEFELLEHLLDTGWVTRIGHLQIQFHGFVRDAAARTASIRRRLVESHRCDWSCEPFWESWSRDRDRDSIVRGADGESET